MLDQFVEFVQGLSPIGILAFAMMITFLENIFPPSPSDMLMVFCGALAGVGAVNAPMLVAAGALGGTAGFLVMYWLGWRYGNAVFQSRLLRFIPQSSLSKVEEWFERRGDWIILGNRFLSGTRAVISLFAGMSKLHLPKTLMLSFVGTLIWNTLLVIGGYLLGDNWRLLGAYLSLYGRVISVVLICALFCWGMFRYLRKRNTLKK